MIDKSIICNMKFISVDDVKDEGGGGIIKTLNLVNVTLGLKRLNNI